MVSTLMDVHPKPRPSWRGHTHYLHHIHRHSIVEVILNLPIGPRGRVVHDRSPEHTPRDDVRRIERALVDSTLDRAAVEPRMHIESVVARLVVFILLIIVDEHPTPPTGRDTDIV